MARHCVFCGLEGRMSEEHVFGRWLLEYEFQTDRETHMSGAINSMLHRQGDFVPFTQVVRAVCQDCNNGWLSALEADAKQALDPILKGRETELSIAMANRVATWAFKTTLVAMLTFSRSDREAGRGVPESEYRALYESRHFGLPDGTSSWFGRYDGSKTYSTWIVPQSVLIDGVEVDADYPQGYSSTLVVGPLVIHAFRWTTPLLGIEVEPSVPLTSLVPAVTPIGWQVERPALNDESIVALAMGRGTTTALPHITVSPWSRAVDGPAGVLVNGRVELATLCGLHTISYPYELVAAATVGVEYVFWDECPCAAYLIQTEVDAAHFRKTGDPAAISAYFNELPGEITVLEDRLGEFRCKRLVR